MLIEIISLRNAYKADFAVKEAERIKKEEEKEKKQAEEKRDNERRRSKMFKSILVTSNKIHCTTIQCTNSPRTRNCCKISQYFSFNLERSQIRETS